MCLPSTGLVKTLPIDIKLLNVWKKNSIPGLIKTRAMDLFHYLLLNWHSLIKLKQRIKSFLRSFSRHSFIMFAVIQEQGVDARADTEALQFM